MIPRRKEDNAIFLAKKARGFGTGKWMGFGGKLERGESVPHANLREFYEETGVKVSSCDCSKVGLLLFTFKTKPGFYLEVHVYETYKMLNPIALCDELSGNGQWFPPDCVPFDVSLYILHMASLSQQSVA